MLIAEPLDQALERTRHLLFSPFDLTKWVCFGVIVFLDVLIKGSFLSVFNIWSYDIPGILNDAEEKFGDIWPTIESNATVIVGVLIVALFAYLIFAVLTTWLSSRGQLMFVRAVSLDDHAIDLNWAGVRELSGSLF